MLTEFVLKKIKTQYFSKEFKKLSIYESFCEIDFKEIYLANKIDCFNSDNVKRLFPSSYSSAPPRVQKYNY